MSFQTFLILGILGMPSTWLDVLTLDLDLVGLLKESPSSLGGFISVFGTLLAFVRPTIPGDSPHMLRTLFPLAAWFLFSDEATVRHEAFATGITRSYKFAKPIQKWYRQVLLCFWLSPRL